MGRIHSSIYDHNQHCNGDYNNAESRRFVELSQQWWRPFNDWLRGAVRQTSAAEGAIQEKGEVAAQLVQPDMSKYQQEQLPLSERQPSMMVSMI